MMPAPSVRSSRRGGGCSSSARRAGCDPGDTAVRAMRPRTQRVLTADARTSASRPMLPLANPGNEGQVEILISLDISLDAIAPPCSASRSAVKRSARTCFRENRPRQPGLML